MTDRVVRDKVLCYIVREGHLLVFRHTDYSYEEVGIQRRHVFHLEPAGTTPERWTSLEHHDVEREPTRFECFWIPLEAAHVLQSGQGALLGRLAP